MRAFTGEELRQWQGESGAPICLAYQGKVYAATGSKGKALVWSFLPPLSRSRLPGASRVRH